MLLLLLLFCACVLVQLSAAALQPLQQLLGARA